MNKLSKEKQQQLILTGLVTLVILAGLWYLLIRAQVSSIKTIEGQCVTAEKRLSDVKQTVARAKQIEEELEAATKVLDRCEENMASGDLYAWAVTSIRNFKTPYKIEIPQFSQIDGPRDSTILPDFPYKQVALTIAGTGQYNDIGTFIAGFENQFPFTRVCNLMVETPTQTGASEKLNFRMDVVALVKPAN